MYIIILSEVSVGLRQDWVMLPSLFNVLFGCTATSAPSERVFSIAGHYFTPNRAQLNATSFRSMIMIKCNSELFEKMSAF